LRAILGRIARDFGTPCFVYFVDEVRERVEQLRSFFGDRFLISYAVKCNPNLGLLRTLRGVVDMLDVSSVGEVTRALEAGWMAAELGFTGPGKRETELQTSVEAGVGEIIVESVDEADLLNRIAARVGRKQRILVRLGPARVPRGFGLNMSGKPSQFGVDEEEIDAGLDRMQEMAYLDLCGFHIYSGTQCLDAEAISENYEIFIDLFQRVCSSHGIQPQRLIFGSGIGIPYFDNDTAVDLGAAAERINPALDELKSTAAFSATELILETGRFLVGEAGVYITRVIRKKCSRGIEICICDGGMNHHMAAAGHLGVVPRNYRMLKITGSDEGPERAYNIVGPLCTTIDTLGRQVKFKGLEAGDVIGIRSSGAYGLTVSPIQFISHPPPREILVETVEGRIVTQEGSEPDGMGVAAASQRAIQ
jgi:diaminopimelate decarboxylase